MKKIDMEAELKKWNSYCEKADAILTKFDEEVKAHQKKYNRKLKLGVGIVAVAATVFTGGVAAIASVASGAVSALGGAAAASLIGGGAAGGLGLSMFGSSIYALTSSFKRRKVLETECNELKSQLECIKLEYEGKNIDLNDKLAIKINQLKSPVGTECCGEKRA
ncbi:uncharacterized protein LOC144649260 [Oculina patagonica]